MQGESVKMGKFWFRVITKMPFRNWINKYYGDWDAFINLKKKDREKIFLRWKWGTKDEDLAEENETHEKQMLFLTKDANLADMDEGWRFHIEKKRAFDRECYEIKKKIELIEELEPAEATF